MIAAIAPTLPTRRRRPLSRGSLETGSRHVAHADDDAGQHGGTLSVSSSARPRRRSVSSFFEAAVGAVRKLAERYEANGWHDLAFALGSLKVSGGETTNVVGGKGVLFRLESAAVG